jgi:hypothetical protein
VGLACHFCSLISAYLPGADLEAADLTHSDLRDAYLGKANLRDARLMSAQLSGANFENADLRNARLAGAILESQDKTEEELELEIEASDSEDFEPEPRFAEVDLTGADLRGADFSDAKLSDVVGLLSSSLAGTNLSNARLPPDIARFDLLDHVAEISKSSRNTFLAMIGACVYSWLTIASTTQQALQSNTPTTALPFVGTTVPIAGFHLVAPIVLLAVYIYLHMYLQRLWSSLGSLPAYFPDGRPLDEKAYPWLLSSLVRVYVPWLMSHRPPLWWLQVGVSFFMAWGLVPLTIGLFIGSFARTGQWQGLLLLSLIELAVIVLGVVNLRMAGRSLRGEFRREAIRQEFEGYVAKHQEMMKQSNRD